ncbi:MAG: DUF1475 family protein [Phycisphaerales bacterium JB041]
MRILTVTCGSGIAALVTLIVVSSLEMSLAAGLLETVDTLWGVTTLVDLYAGLLLIGVWIAVRERRVVPTTAWLIGLCCLGNLAALVYVFIASLRARSLEQLLLGDSGPQSASTAG